MIVSAYTIVMKSGRHIEIPETFTVTRDALTYEATPGMRVILPLSNVDIAATEQANGESSGSLLRRAAQRQPPQQETAPRKDSASASTASATPSQLPHARRTLTNQDLERGRRAREQSEAAYEKRRVQLGLPSKEEMARRAQIEAEQTRATVEQKATDQAQTESYWRARASALREEIASIEGEINYLRARLGEIDFNTPLLPSGIYGTSVAIYPPFIGRSFGWGGLLPQPPLLNAQIGNVNSNLAFNNVPLNSNLNFSSTPQRLAAQGSMAATLGRLGTAAAINRGVIPIRRPYIFYRGAPPLVFFGVPYPNYYNGYDGSYERETIRARLNELETARAGLLARWRVLEEEARRAGVPPGWLRP
jgi:hypothetical protein